jgi:hypothetical protein
MQKRKNNLMKEAQKGIGNTTKMEHEKTQRCNGK